MKIIEHLHAKLNLVYYIDYEIDADLYNQFQESETPEVLGFTFDRVYVEPVPLDPEEN